MSDDKKQISVDEETCIGCALCTTIAPETFELLASGKAQALHQGKHDEPTLQAALDACPVAAIYWGKKSQKNPGKYPDNE